MTCSPQFHIPGSFISDVPPPPPPPPMNTGGGVHPNGVFRPPVSPSPASSSFLGRSAISEANAAPKPKRKRMDEDRENTPEWRVGGTGIQGSRWFDGGGGVGGGDFTPGREVRYTLAGQIDTPGGAATPGAGDGILDESVYSDVDYRRALGPKQDVSLEFATAAEAHQSGWGQLALGAIGGVVGKVWDFCKGGAFKGFYAGGGRGFSIQGVGESPDHPTSTDHAPLPGYFPTFESIPAYPDSSVPDAIPMRPSVKRRQVSEANDDLRRNWVIVDEPHSERRRAHQTRRTTTGRASTASGRRITVPVSRLSNTPTPSLARRHTHRVSHAGSPALMNREPASFASPRSSRPASPAPSPSRIPVPSPIPTNNNNRTWKSSGIPSPVQTSFNSHRRTHSGASSASTRTKPRVEKLDVDEIEASPRLNAEAKRLAAKKLLDEEDTDARISAFNSRLRDMIRQGKEALGTQVEVSMEEGGWLDEE